MKIKNRLKNNTQKGHSSGSTLSWEPSSWLSLTMARRIAIFALLLLIALLCAKITWLLIPTPASTIESGKVTNKEAFQATPKNPNTAIRQLSGLEIFGPTSAEKKKNIDIQNAKESRLSLILNGVLASNIEQHSRAIISHNNKQASYQAGDSLPVSDNVTLSQVLADRVIIDNRGKYETLWLVRDSEKSPPAAKQYRKKKTAVQRPVQRMPSRNLKKRNNITQSSSNSLSLINFRIAYLFNFLKLKTYFQNHQPSSWLPTTQTLITR